MSELSSNESGDQHATNLQASSSSTTVTASPNTAAGQTTAVVAELSQFLPYLKQLVALLIDANLNPTASASEFDKCLSDKSSLECIRKFINDPQTRNLIIQKLQTKGT